MINRKPVLRIASSTIALLCATVSAPAWAQTKTQVEDPAKPADQTDSADAEQLSSTKTDDDAGEKDIVVTGTGISGVKPVGNQVIVVTAEDAVKTGYSTPAEVLRTLPQVRVGEFDTDGGRSTGSPQNAVGASTVSLRAVSGAGNSNQTLILVNGRRQVSGGTNQTYTDANQVPLAALERIEIVADGASAIYGSDAVAGVINYVLRKDYRGGEFRIRSNNNQGGLDYGLDATLGTSWHLGGLGAGNVLVSYGYTKRDSYLRGKNAFFRSDLRPLGGLDGRVSGTQLSLGNIPAIIVSPAAGPQNPLFPRAGANVYFGLPDGANVGVTAGQLGLNDIDVIDNSFFNEYNGRLERHQATINFTQELGSSIELYAQGTFSDRQTRTLSLGTATTVQLRSRLRNAAGAVTDATNPFYIFNVPGVSQGAPAGVITIPGFPFPIPVPATPAADLTVALPQLRLGPQVFLGSDRSYNATVGTRIDLPGKWKGDIFYTLGRNEGCTYCILDGGYVNLQALQYQVDLGNINPLSTLPLTAAQRATFSGTQRQIGHNGIDDFAARFNGPLFDLPAGTIRGAVGIEQIKTFAWNENRSVTGALNTPIVLTDRANSYIDETVRSAFGELYVPVINGNMNIPLVESLLLSGAIRYDQYRARNVDAWTPKFGFDWKFGDIFSLRGSWSKSFRAPSLSEVNPAAYVSGSAINGLPRPGYNANPALDRQDLRINCTPVLPDYCATNVALLFGSNPTLTPESSTNWSLSGDFNPGGGVKVSATYYNIKYKDRISFPNVLSDFLGGPNAGGGQSPVYPLGYGQYIVPINNPATCVNTDLSTADPVLQKFLQGPVYALSGGLGQLGGLQEFCGINVVVDSRFTNLATTFTDGLDFSVSFNRGLGGVQLNSSATVNVILNNSVQATPGGLSSDQTGRVGGSVKWRGRGNIGLTKDGFNATLFGNYYGSFVNDENVSQPLGAEAPDVKIPSYTTFDLTLGFGTRFEGRNPGFLKGLRGSFTITNLFDKDPPLVLRGDRVLLEGYGLPLGRTFSLTITSEF